MKAFSPVSSPKKMFPVRDQPSPLATRSLLHTPSSISTGAFRKLVMGAPLTLSVMVTAAAKEGVGDATATAIASIASRFFELLTCMRRVSPELAHSITADERTVSYDAALSNRERQGKSRENDLVCRSNVKIRQDANVTSGRCRIVPGCTGFRPAERWACRWYRRARRGFATIRRGTGR